MGEIFRAASRVNIWLGEASNDSDLAMAFIPQISVVKVDLLARDPMVGASWKALANLMRRPWFTRRWIVQELAFAKQAVLLCGSLEVDWTSFSEATTLFVDKADQVDSLFCIMETWATFKNNLAKAAQAANVVPQTRDPYGVGRWLSAFGTSIVGQTTNQIGMLTNTITGSEVCWEKKYLIGEIRGVGAHSLVTALDLIIRKEFHTDVTPERLCSMEDLLPYLPAFPHDIVYAVASLAKDSSNFIPDYTKSILQVCTHVLKNTIRTSGSLNIMCRPWAPTFPEAPSWIPQLSGLSFTQNSEGTHIRKHADSLVGLPNRHTYTASGSIPASAVFDSECCVLLSKDFSFRLSTGYRVQHPRGSFRQTGLKMKISEETVSKRVTRKRSIGVSLLQTGTPTTILPLHGTNALVMKCINSPQIM
jgi:hypothetical protein